MVRSIGFIGVRTIAFDETVAVLRDGLGLRPIAERPGDARFATEDGCQLHVYGGEDDDHRFFGAGPVVGYLVDDFDATRAALLSAGVTFIGEPQRAGGQAWSHYRGPDGNVYEIIGPDRMAG